jgi:hypothetical protein
MRDLNSVIPNAPDFTYNQLIRSETAIRKGIDNTPQSEDLFKALEYLAVNGLQKINDNFGKIRVTSGYRCLELNRAIGSGDTSNHVRGCAADIEPTVKGVTLMDLLIWIYDNLDYQELIAEFFPTGWCHYAIRDGVNAKNLKLKDKNHNYSIVTIDYIKSIYS